jgi:hypothetical protein
LEQHVGVHLLEGALSLKEALGLEQTVTIGGIECRVLLPVPDPDQSGWVRWSLAGPPVLGEDQQDPGWPKSMMRNWGEIIPVGAIIRAVGIIPAGAVIPPGDEHIAFDLAVAHWRRLLRDWLAVAAEGPTDFPDRGYYGATTWGLSEYDDEEIPYQPPQLGNSYGPKRLSALAWCHALTHASAGDQPSLARTLMTSATQAATTANWRVAVIDAATATEVALTTGLTARLSATLSPGDVNEKLDGTRMLGPRIQLATTLGMPLPSRIKEDLVNYRNAVVHKGTDITGAQAKAAIAAAWAVVRQYDSLPT